MASIYTGNQYAQSYGGGYIAKRARADADEEKANKAKEGNDTATTSELEAYKQAFVKTVKEKVAARPELEGARINLDITNGAFEKMRTDPAYEKKVLDLFDSKLDKKYPLPPVGITITADENGEDARIDYGQSDELFANRRNLGAIQRAFLRTGVQSMRNDVLSSIQNRFSGASQSGAGSLLGGGNILGNYDVYA